jgi:hypothetical protein
MQSLHGTDVTHIITCCYCFFGIAVVLVAALIRWAKG